MNAFAFRNLNTPAGQGPVAAGVTAVPRGALPAGGATCPDAATALAGSLDAARVELGHLVCRKHQAEFGQFMTPSPVAATMANMFSPCPREVRLLDPGAGMGALTAAFVASALASPAPPVSIEVTACEQDPALVPVLGRTLMNCAHQCAAAGVRFTYRIVADDYLLMTPSENCGAPRFNRVITNPPYVRFPAKSAIRKTLLGLGHRVNNAYTAFLSVALSQMEDGGELVAITPRSFCNGATHRAFRALLLEATALRALHLYHSRSEVFRDDKVLQEVIILKMAKGRPADLVRLSSDAGGARDVPFRDVVVPSDSQQFIRIPLPGMGGAVRVLAQPCSLDDLGVTVSTGPIIENRCRPCLRTYEDAGSVPLLHQEHLAEGTVRWPLVGFRKSNALADHPDVARHILPAGTYLLVKRIAAKEAKRRVTVVVHTGDRMAIENHLNYLHMNGAGLPPDFARGLAIYLSSPEVDQCVRTFCGTTQINAADLKALRYPSNETLGALGRGIISIEDVLSLTHQGRT